MNLEAFFKISYGIYIVSARDNDKLNGFISNTVFQVTSEPPLFAISCSKDNYTAQLIQSSNVFAVTALRKDASAGVIGTFGFRSGKDFDKFANIKYFEHNIGAPVVLQDGAAWIVFNVEKTLDLVSHLLFIARAIDSEIIDPTAELLTYTYYREVKKGKAPKNAPTYLDMEKIKAALTTEKLHAYYCPTCGYIFDPSKGDLASGIAAGKSFENLPPDWVCPVCGTGKEDFIMKMHT
jgi:flavin reductase (DIM6/NTAB) family NADH-FMN oxidoreductase RutF/rubredoxin